jgi:uncharacterized membrane protein YfhO
VAVRNGIPALLVLSDANYPGWLAYVDGSPAPILTANGMFRAVELQPGDHVVEFLYDPTVFRLGAGITALTLALGGFALAASLRSRRRTAAAGG